MGTSETVDLYEDTNEFGGLTLNELNAMAPANLANLEFYVADDNEPSADNQDKKVSGEVLRDFFMQSRIADSATYPPNSFAIDGIAKNIVKGPDDQYHLLDESGGQIPLGREKEQWFSGIIRPINNAGAVDGWEFIQDSAHYGGEFIGTPTMDLVGNSIQMNFSVQIDLIKTGFVGHDGQFVSFQPGLSINTTKLSLSIFEQRSPWVSYQYRVDTGAIVSAYRTPYDRATGTSEVGNGFESISHVLTGNELELTFANNTYRGYPHVQINYNGTLYHWMHVYSGASAQPNTIKGRLFDASGAALTTIPGNFRLNINWEVNQEMDRIRVPPNDPRLLGPNSANYWILGRLKRN